MSTKTCKKCGLDKDIGEFYHHRAACKSCCSTQRKVYRRNNVTKLKKKSKEWYHKTKESRKAHKAKYYRERRKLDVLFALKSGIVRLIRTSINRGGFTKKSKTVDILGCSYEEFKNYIESKFEPWMTWENKGKYNGHLNYGWDIDHIIPLSSATCEADILRLNHYTNLQPLCSKINRDVKRINIWKS
jgi:hypothetical protein